MDRGFDYRHLTEESYIHGNDSFFYTSVIQNRVNWVRAMWTAGVRPYNGDAQKRGLLQAMAALSVGQEMMAFLIECDASAILIPWNIKLKH